MNHSEKEVLLTAKKVGYNFIAEKDGCVGVFETVERTKNGVFCFDKGKNVKLPIDDFPTIARMIALCPVWTVDEAIEIINVEEVTNPSTFEAFLDFRGVVNDQKIFESVPVRKEIESTLWKFIKEDVDKIMDLEATIGGIFKASDECQKTDEAYKSAMASLQKADSIEEIAKALSAYVLLSEDFTADEVASVIVFLRMMQVSVEHFLNKQ